MEIMLPQKMNSQESIKVDSKCIVLVGANGSGKTRFGSEIEAKYNDQTHRIAAQKSLSMPSRVSSTSKEFAEADFLYGYPDANVGYKIGHRWGSKPNTFLLNDYEKLMILLHTDEADVSIKFKDTYKVNQADEKPITKLDKVQRIWELVLPHRKLSKKRGVIEVYGNSSPLIKYNASEMSDGERVVFYLIGQVVSVPENAIIIIDEPEMHIHKSITKKLWDEIENERPDCTFVYLTHDIDFAVSRQGSTKVWIKSFDGTNWDYEVLDKNAELPEQLFLEILGSRNPVLFIEGDSSSIDYKVLQLVFSGYTTIPVGNCNKVFEATKAFNGLKTLHQIESFGLIDRDRRTNEEVDYLKSEKIWITEVAEIENFLLLEEVVRSVAVSMMKNPDDVFMNVKSNIIQFFKSQIEKQALEHTIFRIERIFNKVTNNSTVKDIDELERNLNKFWEEQKFGDIYIQTVDSFNELIDNGDYAGILAVFNNKGLLANSGVTALCDLNGKNDSYLNYVIGILKQKNHYSETIKSAILNKIKR